MSAKEFPWKEYKKGEVYTTKPSKGFVMNHEYFKFIIINSDGKIRKKLGKELEWEGNYIDHSTLCNSWYSDFENLNKERFFLFIKDITGMEVFTCEGYLFPISEEMRPKFESTMEKAFEQLKQDHLKQQEKFKEISELAGIGYL